MRFSILSGLVALMVARPASATAIMLFVGKDGIVLSADSKLSIEGRESTKPMRKIVQIGARAYLATYGASRITDDSVVVDGKPWVYDYDALAAKMARRHKDTDTAATADALWHEAQRIFGPVGSGLAEVRRQILFVVVGIDAGVPHAWEVKVFPTPTDLRVEKEEILPSAAGEAWRGNGFAPGDLEGAAALIGEARRRAPQLFTPTADFDDRASFSGLLVALRGEHAPKTVGPPVRQVILLRGGRVIERTWSEQLLRPHKARLGQDKGWYCRRGTSCSSNPRQR